MRSRRKRGGANRAHRHRTVLVGEAKGRGNRKDKILACDFPQSHAPRRSLGGWGEKIQMLVRQSWLARICEGSAKTKRQGGSRAVSVGAVVQGGTLNSWKARKKTNVNLLGEKDGGGNAGGLACAKSSKSPRAENSTGNTRGAKGGEHDPEFG